MGPRTIQRIADLTSKTMASETEYLVAKALEEWGCGPEELEIVQQTTPTEVRVFVRRRS